MGWDDMEAMVMAERMIRRRRRILRGKKDRHDMIGGGDGTR